MKYILLLTLIATGCATNNVPKTKAPVRKYSRSFNLENGYCPTISHDQWKRAGDSYKLLIHHEEMKK